jgi:hypothetical protein
MHFRSIDKRFPSGFFYHSGCSWNRMLDTHASRASDRSFGIGVRMTSPVDRRPTTDFRPIGRPGHAIALCRLRVDDGSAIGVATAAGSPPGPPPAL